MAYIGNSPANVGSYQEVDTISSFNGSLTSFALTAGSSAISPAKSGQLLVSLNGVMQEPDDTGTNGFKVSGSNIVFSSAPATGSTFWAMFQGNNVDVGTPSAGVVGLTELSATGTASATTFLRGDNTWVVPTDTTKLPLAGGTMTGAITTLAITETEATSSATTYTVDLANGTLFEVTSATTCTVTMPTAAAGKSFTVISTVPAAWSGTIIWSGGAAPTTGSAKTIYSFISNGSSWYGMQSGTGFA
jgi:hypothetical protein